MQGTGRDIAAVVLAAGRSARMGRNKALLPVGGETFVGRAVHALAAAGADPVLVVVAGERADLVADATAGRAGLVVNPDPDRGQLSSLQCGLAALPVSTAAVLITPVDFPLVRPETIARLVQEWRARGSAVIRPVSQGRHGHPVLVSRRVVEALQAAAHDQTARTVMQMFAAEAQDVPVDDEGAFVDIDTREEYLRVLGDGEVESGK